MIRSFLAAPIALAVLALPAAAQMIDTLSPHAVHVTMDRLEAAVQEAGATVFARVDHAAGAADADMELRPTELLIFGNPALGTPAMQDGQTAGLDLPMRVLAFADSEGVVHVTYHDPAALALAHGLPEDAAYLQKMTDALAQLTGKATAEE
ncbi:camphor resistance protein CrcB [Sulfitobacter alexandrii]|uniref:Camphor resistance protein CrcB n=1 Tax=Sulfitobacter alexandrii TaxID=1917485 RepID=A0A1J0WI17_9RHOB|nr:DUF302 domain-containing protein [Sulfitobacter alexandrii]APE43975.1 camphor resistance protein CrcB [Sulfitobacter alexandrii]